MKATKGNKSYTITEAEKKRYQDAGYDITDDVGKVIVHGRGKTMSYEKYEEVKAENEALKKENAELKAAAEQKDDIAVIEILKAYAAEHEVDIGSTTTVAGIVKKIQKSSTKEGE